MKKKTSKILTAKEMGERSAETRKTKFGPNYGKLMSHIRKGKKLSTFKPELSPTE